MRSGRNYESKQIRSRGFINKVDRALPGLMARRKRHVLK